MRYIYNNVRGIGCLNENDKNIYEKGGKGQKQDLIMTSLSSFK